MKTIQLVTIGAVSVIGLLLISTTIYYAVTIVKAASPPLQCSDGAPARTALNKSHNAQLRKLAEYETVCKGEVTDTLMTFAAMPTSETEATQLAQAMAQTLKLLNAQRIGPLVVFEPTTKSPTVLNDIATGKYDSALEHYYTSLQQQGITDEQMGTWVLLPEANTPIWNITNPDTFSTNVTKLASMQKRYYPQSKATIMLNSYTYPDNDSDWAHGTPSSLQPYVQNIPKGLLDSIGLQGFPYAPPANSGSSDSLLAASDFLPSSLAIEAADTLGVSQVWLNTGTFKRAYANDPRAQVRLSASDRGQILGDIAKEAKAIQNHSLSVSVNLFAADKSQEPEHTDWSYWPTGKANSSQDTATFKAFLQQLRAQQSGFSLYDH